jgi:hypothetical protein
VSYLKLSIKFTSACHVPMVYCCTGWELNLSQYFY